MKLRIFILVLSVVIIFAGCGGRALHNSSRSSSGSASASHSAESREETEAEELQKSKINTDAAKQALDNMTAEEKVGQLFILAFRKDEQGNGITEISEAALKAIRDYHIGGVTLFTENIVRKWQTIIYIDDMQKAAGIPLFICIDEEGGPVSRTGNLGNDPGDYGIVERVPSQASVAAEAQEGGSKLLPYKYARDLSYDLMDLGFNLNFAPVADIYSNPDNTVIGERSYGNRPDLVSDMVNQAVSGYEAASMVSVLKHFPGHGDTAEDSHYGRATTAKTLAELRDNEFIPFADNIKAPMIMVGHISAPNITNNNDPATFSSLLINDILKDELGFEGVVITDAMDMKAVSDFYESGEASLNALKAGADIILMPEDFYESYNAVLSAVKSGEITEEELDAKVLRILKCKAEYGILEGGK